MGLSQNHLSKVAFAIGGLVTFQGLAWEVVETLWMRVPGMWRTVLVILSPLLLVVSPVIIALGSVLISVITAVLRHWQLQFGWGPTRPHGGRTSSRVAEPSISQIPLKVQSVTWEKWIRRMFSMDTAHIDKPPQVALWVEATMGGGNSGTAMRMGTPP